MTELQLAIEKIREIDAEFADVCAALYAQRFTGMTPLHWRNGVPARLDIGSTQVWLARRCSPKAVDKRTEVPDAVTV